MITKLHSIRKSSGWKQNELAEHIGISPGHLSNMEHGRRTPTPEQLIELCKALKCKPTDILRTSEGMIDKEAILNLFTWYMTSDDVSILEKNVLKQQVLALLYTFGQQPS